MNWDKKNKRGLYDAFVKKADESFLNKTRNMWGRPDHYAVMTEWETFLKSLRSLGVEEIFRPGEDLWDKVDGPVQEDGDYLIVLDPVRLRKYMGLKVPKDIAEKFLIFGIP